MNLSDAFGEDLKNQFAKRNIDIGKALLLKVESINVTYPKYIIIVALSKDRTPEEVAYVFINTEVNPNILSNQYLRDQNLQIRKEEHHFLEYDSFVDCSRISTFLTSELIEKISSNPKIIVGNIEEKLLSEIHKTIIHSKTISRKDKKMFGFL